LIISNPTDFIPELLENHPLKRVVLKQIIDKDCPGRRSAYLELGLPLDETVS
jgi:hypothetical protein